MSNAPIGIFDSGVGGLTVAREVRAQLPHESIIYIGDTEHTPYGPRPIAEIRKYSLEILDELVDEGVKMLVIACNSASAAVLRDARERYSVPVIEVIAPAVRAAVSATRTGRVGVIGTEATIGSRAYHDAFAAAVDVELFSQACPLFVEHVEQGDTTSPELIAIARDYLAPLQEHDIDTLVLGCTHYPLLQGVLGYVMGQEVRLVSSDVETAKDVYRTLLTRDLLHDGSTPPRYEYRATGSNTTAFMTLASRILGGEVSKVEHHPTGVIDVVGTAMKENS
ncbi:glutamate racemase [Gulosibacter faecalis]|uniref:Glutamate racemase n=1 Tax=Gulosibacter faecalis TaxID=272240 RepID=A0ABW5V0V6_9MICO|nr:glutamate racemase [Gulosibacter faecalis]